MRKILILAAQKVVRVGLRLPLVGAFFWRMAPRVRKFFAARNNLGTFQTKFDDGIKIWVSLSDHIESQAFWQGVQESDRGEARLLKRLLKPGLIFVDVGANVGLFTLMAANHVETGEVHAFEPYRGHLERLRRNLRLNGFDNVIVNAVGLSNLDATEELFIPDTAGVSGNSGAASIYHPTDTTKEHVTEKVQIMKFDDYVAQQGLHNIDIVKLDVEGAELDVLEGSVGSIDKYQPSFVMEVNQSCLNRAGRTTEEVFNFWERRGYATFLIKDSGELASINAPLTLRGQYNIYCTPKVPKTL